MSSNIEDSIEGNHRLEYTLNIRKEAIDKLISKGKIPENKDEKSLLISLLDGMDRTVLSRAKVKVDAKTNDISTQANVLVAKLLTKVNPKAIMLNNFTDTIQVPVLDSTIPKPSLIEGETLIGTVNETFDNFMTRME